MSASDISRLGASPALKAADTDNRKKVLEAMNAFKNDEYLWWQVAEYTFDSFMIRTRARG